MKTLNPDHPISTSLKRLPKTLLAPACIIAILASTSAQAQLLSTESFNGYTPGTLLSAESPASPTVAGYTGNWSGGLSQQTFAGSLAYGGAGYAAGTGNHIGVLANASGVDWWQGGGEMARALDSSLVVTSATTGTRYLSWLFESSTQAQYQMLLLNDAGTRTFGAGLSFNDPGDGGGLTYDFEVNTAATNTGVTATTAVNLFVVKFELSAATGADNVTVWLNPTLEGWGDPAGGMAITGTNLIFDNLRIADYGANPANWDEIRWGNTFNDVTIGTSSPQAKILTFGPGATIGPVAGNAAAILWTVPYGSNLAALAPTFTLSDGATCTVNGNPAASGSTQNFTTSPVHYIVKASDFATSGKTTDYTVTVNMTPASSAKNIVSFGPGGVISGTDISWLVPFGSDVSNLAPTYSVSTFASQDVSFPSGTPRNFTTPKTYTITAQDTTTQTYTVTVTVSPPTPGGVTGLALWLDASAPDTMTLDGTTVNEWRDKLGGGARMTRDHGAPTVVASGIGAIPTVHFSASSMGDGVNHAAPVTILYVSRQTGGAKGRALSGGNNWLLGYWGGNKNSAHFGQNFVNVGSTTDTNPHLYAATIPGTGSNSTVWAEGAQIASNQGGTEGPNGLFVGGGGAYLEYSDCDISEVLVYHRILNSTELDAVGTYLTTKYGLTTIYPPDSTLYDTWANGTFANPFTAKLPTDDPDGDGQTNQQEFVFGLDPTTGSSVNPIAQQLDKPTGVFKYTRTKDSGLIYNVYYSTNLVGWAWDEFATQTPAAAVAGVETVTVTLAAATPLDGKLFVRVEGARTYPTGQWRSEPPADCPFEPSTAHTGVVFTGRHAEYTGADTWYPSWASDGNLYSPWTDGEVNGLGIGSGGDGAATGHATIRGDDPLNLTITDQGAFNSSPRPYDGRYPCGSLVYNGVWYYGTYCLHPSWREIRDGIPYNWPWLGPIPGFRWSTNFGNTWNETPGTPANPLFGESALNGEPLKIGAPHFVDFGKNMEHSPDGKAYLTAHGASVGPAGRRFAYNSWMTGDEIHLVRVTPSIANINDVSKYEFFAGNDTSGNPQWSHDFGAIKPLAAWMDNMGCVTMTYNAPLKKYFMCVTDGGNTVHRFNTYILESDLVTGPWKLVTYLKNFGQQAYFVNIPSKFISGDGRTMWLCYSANFAVGWTDVDIQALPEGSKYAMCLQEIKLLGR